MRKVYPISGWVDSGNVPDADFASLVAALSKHWAIVPEALRPMIGAQIVAMVKAVASK